MSNTKIYVVKRSDGKYYNHIDNFFPSRLSLGTYSPKKSDMEGLIKLKGFQDCEVDEVLEEDWTKDMATLTTSTIIQIDSLRRKLDNIRYILPTVSGMNKNIKNFLQNTSEKLKIINPIFKEFIEKKEDATDEVTQIYDEFIHEIAELEMWQLGEVTAVIKAYKKDKSSVLGITKKIIKN